jgi:hypothetical protein
MPGRSRRAAAPAASEGVASPSTAASGHASTTTASPTVELPGHEGHDHATFLTPDAGLYSGEAYPAPAVAGRQQIEANGAQISGDGVSSTAIDVTERIMASVANRPDIQERLGEANTRVVIIPAGSKMTDLPEFSALAGTQTFDGRNWDGVRGQGGMQVGDEWLVAIPEENLVQTSGTPDPYHGDYSVGMHEIAHTIHSKGMSDEEREQLDALFAAQQTAGPDGAAGEFTGSYGAANVQEYFAQATNAFFGNNTIGENGASWLQENDADLHAFLVQIYGAADEGIARAEAVRDRQAAEALEDAEPAPPATTEAPAHRGTSPSP